MLQMNCQNCGKLIVSSLLSEVQLFVCPKCKEIVFVNDVVITNKKTPRSTFLYLKNILFAAKEKYKINKCSNIDTRKNYDIDKRLAIFLRRDDFRLDSLQ
jgi:phage FluMu protein Com